MRLGILIIGSLYWDPSRIRCRWRQNRLSCSEKREVMVPIRYGKKSSKKRGGTYTMVFARSCSDAAKLGKGLVVPVRAECCEPEHLFEEVEHLWAAERDVEQILGFCRDWGKVCVLKSPKVDAENRILQAWYMRIRELGGTYTALSAAAGEDAVLDPATGLALFDWPKDVATKEDLAGFDLLLMTANEPTLNAGQYPTADQIAAAWRDDGGNNVMYFYNNRHHGITTFEDDAIQAVLRGDPPNPALQPTSRARGGKRKAKRHTGAARG